MRGEFVAVWSDMWREVWTPLVAHEEVPADVYCELYREVCVALRSRPSVERLAEVIDDPVHSRRAFEAISGNDFDGERALTSFLERLHPILGEFGDDALSGRYVELLAAFIDKFSLRYDLRPPCALCPTLPGVFASLVRDLRLVTSQDPHLEALMTDFENAVCDLRDDCSDGRIKTCIQKQVNLLEALGAGCPGVTSTELGAICNEIESWPHAAVRASLRNLYGFASNYPGIRHSGNPASALRPIEMRDMIAVSILLVGFTPYLSAGVNPELVFRGD